MQARQMEGISLFTWWKNLGLQARFMVFTSIGLLGVALSVMVAVGWFEVSRVEEKLRNTSDSELKSLNALVSAAMEQYAGGTKDVALTVFNRWFDHRNVDYPGKLWSVWSPQMAAFMAQTAGSADKSAPASASKPPRDAIDDEALRTGRPVGRFVDGAYRYSLPVVLGVTSGTNQKSCFDCHGATMTWGTARCSRCSRAACPLRLISARCDGCWRRWQVPRWWGHCSWCWRSGRSSHA